ncbi:enterotoxin [Paraburkholderia sp. MMS20-SJTN17]|uniref:Enterotoxin n=1 Tax=Paraburkholderia translucens TaxID=2886945 RepID=A0ABS8KD67_9BURK|nr:enterotoxin [Paraburkholderia sp. MMS20-SJTN17]MCC8402705.1 enterotoxin [Paraburkholderia sp. MMS20-SJTN17]
MPVLQTTGDRYSFGNAAIVLNWTVRHQRLADFALTDRVHTRTLRVIAPFALSSADGRTLGIADLRLLAPLREEMLTANPKASRLADRIAGRRVRAMLGDEAGRLQVEWSVEQRESSQYLRLQVAITAISMDEHIATISLLETQVSGAQTTGELKGTPAVAGNVYLGFEHPLSESQVRGDTVRLILPRALPLEKSKTCVYSAVAGVARDGQLRRDFAAYLERERARPYRPFLHYNGWYDIGYLTPYTQQQALERIEDIGRELHDKRGVQLDSFLFDDGWDDYSGSWRFNKGFPHGFVPLRDAAARYGASPGVWLSPWGGYGSTRQERVTRGRTAGYEIIDGCFALSGPKYYRRFHEAVMELLVQHGINQFKFDGIGNADKVAPGSRFNSDWDAAIRLIEDIREVRPETFVNLTVGSYPSPFWLRYVDSIWRGGKDDDLAGVGSNRERWITYRDAQTYRNVVVTSPLFPLNSLMLHGIIYAQFNDRLNTAQGQDFANEVHSYFGSGTQLQELYITPSLLGDGDWDVLAESARWARANAEVLRDSHWIGGAPDRLEVYGWAAWSPVKAIITLRNPDSRAKRFALDLRRQLELPAGAAGRFQTRSVWHDHALHVPPVLDANQPQTISLAPFEVLTLELVSAGGES